MDMCIKDVLDKYSFWAQNLKDRDYRAINIGPIDSRVLFSSYRQSFDNPHMFHV